MHASISAHIAQDYLQDEMLGVWAPNLELFKERIENLYFTYLFVLRAAIKAGPLLAAADYNTGCAEQDRLTAEIVQKLVSCDLLC